MLMKTSIALLDVETSTHVDHNLFLSFPFRSSFSRVVGRPDTSNSRPSRIQWWAKHTQNPIKFQLLFCKINTRSAASVLKHGSIINTIRAVFHRNLVSTKSPFWNNRNWGIFSKCMHFKRIKRTRAMKINEMIPNLGIVVVRKKFICHVYTWIRWLESSIGHDEFGEISVRCIQEYRFQCMSSSPDQIIEHK